VNTVHHRLVGREGEAASAASPFLLIEVENRSIPACAALDNDNFRRLGIVVGLQRNFVKTSVK